MLVILKKVSFDQQLFNMYISLYILQVFLRWKHFHLSNQLLEVR